MAIAPNTLVPSSGVALPQWVWPALLAAVAALWIVTFEGGAISNAISDTGSFLHEYFHDGRHLLGVPCH